MPDISSITRRAQTFAAAAANFSSVTLLTVSDHEGMASFVCTPDRTGADKVALDLAHAVAARAEEVDDLPDLSGTEVIGVMVVNRGSAAGRDSQKGDDPSETARRVEAALRTFGSTADDAPTWVAAALRAAKPRERRRALAWYAHRLGSSNPTHHSSDMNSVVVSIMVGGASRADVKQRINQIAAALPGFDIDVGTQILSTRPASIIAAATGIGIGVGSQWLEQPPFVAEHHPLITAAAAAAGILTAVGLETGLHPDARAQPAQARPGLDVPAAAQTPRPTGPAPQGRRHRGEADQGIRRRLPAVGRRVPRRTGGARRARRPARRCRVRFHRHQRTGRTGGDPRPGRRDGPGHRRGQAGAPARGRPVQRGRHHRPPRIRQVRRAPLDVRLPVPGAAGRVLPPRFPRRGQHADRVRVQGRRRRGDIPAVGRRDRRGPRAGHRHHRGGRPEHLGDRHVRCARLAGGTVPVLLQHARLLLRRRRDHGPLLRRPGRQPVRCTRRRPGHRRGRRRPRGHRLPRRIRW